MKKQVGLIFFMSLFALYTAETKTAVEPAGAVLLGGALLAAAGTIRQKTRKV
ncbi:MAG: hypothetical protein JO336_20090 [Acidobacteriia bacterium]|nr:hypothetical protein [Terriglobia bacterium]